MLDLQQRSDGIILPVRAQPGAKRNAIMGEHDGMLKVSVTQAPEAGKANAAIIAVLAKRLSIAKCRIQQISGDAHRQKRFMVQGCTAEQIQNLVDDM